MLEKIILFTMLLVVLVYPLQNTSSNTDIPQELDSSEILRDEPFSEAQSAPPEISSQNTPTTSSSIDETIDLYSLIPSNSSMLTVIDDSENSFSVIYQYDATLENLKLFYKNLCFIETETTTLPEGDNTTSVTFVDYWQFTGSYQGKSILAITRTTPEGVTMVYIALY